MDEPQEIDTGKVTLVNTTVSPDGSLVESPIRTGTWAWKSKVGLASPDRGRPRHARGGTADEVGGGVERSETSGLAEPALDALATVSITVTNEGPYDGAEVVQLYIRDEYASVTRPVKELKAFKRIFLKNGESATVTFDITPEMLQCFGAENRWSVEPGEFTIMVGSSSADEDLQAISYVVEG